MKILVVGDVILDRYTHGTRRGLAAETPTIVANLIREETFFGGVGLVVRNLLRLRQNVTLLTTSPLGFRTTIINECVDAPTPDELRRLSFHAFPVDGWKVTQKRRYFVEQYKLLQYDVVNDATYSGSDEDDFVRKFKDLLLEQDAVVVCDNRHGVVTEHIAKAIVQMCRKRIIPVYVDSQVSQAKSNHTWYRGSDYIFMNEVESDHALLSMPNVQQVKSRSLGRSHLGEIARFLKADVVYKRGERGSSVIFQENRPTKVDPGFRVDAVDTCGAGDAFLAAFVSTDGDLEFANRWAALSTTYRGTIVPRHEDLEKVTR